MKKLQVAVYRCRYRGCNLWGNEVFGLMPEEHRRICVNFAACGECGRTLDFVRREECPACGNTELESWGQGTSIGCPGCGNEHDLESPYDDGWRHRTPEDLEKTQELHAQMDYEDRLTRGAEGGWSDL